MINSQMIFPRKISCQIDWKTVCIIKLEYRFTWDHEPCILQHKLPESSCPAQGFCKTFFFFFNIRSTCACAPFSSGKRRHLVNQWCYQFIEEDIEDAQTIAMPNGSPDNPGNT